MALFSMYLVNPKFFYTLALWFIAFVGCSLFLSKHLVYLSDVHAESEANISGQLVDSITNVSNIRIFARRAFEVLRLDKVLFITQKKFQKKESFLIMLHSIQGMLIAVMLSFMVYFLIQLYGKSSITIGDFAFILGLCMEVVIYLGTLCPKSMSLMKQSENVSKVCIIL